ncbi:MAG: cytochrome P450 [Mycetocola sp.]
MDSCPFNGMQDLMNLSPEALRRPSEIYRAELEDAPVAWVPGFDSYMVFGLQEITEVLQHPEIFSSSITRGRAAMKIEDDVRGMASREPDMQDLVAEGYGRNPDVRAGSTADPPRHAAQRRLVQTAFSAPRVRAYEPLVRDVVSEVLDQVALESAAAPVDLVATFAAPIPIRILATVLGVEQDDIPDYMRWSVGLLKPVGRAALDPGEIAEMLQCRKEFDRYFMTILLDRIAHPRDDFMTDFATGAGAGEEPLSFDEMLALLEQSVIAGHETSTKAIASALLLLTEHPELLERVRAEPDALDALFDETLRLEGPAQMVHRLALVDTTLGGVDIPAGSAVTSVLASGSRDPRSIERPDELDLSRQDRRGHLGFGTGPHFCVGRLLARLEVTVALGEFLRRFDFELADGIDRDSLDYMRTYAMHGLMSLPVTVRARPSVDV